MSEKKTILFNDSFMTSMGGNKTKKNKKPKKEKPIQAIKPNKFYGLIRIFKQFICKGKNAKKETQTKNS